MAAVRPDASARELRAMMLQAASRSPLPVGAGYLDALSSVLTALNGANYVLGQPPVVRILTATGSGRGRAAQVTAQVGVLGARQGIKRYRVSLGGRVVTKLKSRGSPFTIRIHGRRAKKIRVDALDRHGKTLSHATHRVAKVRPGKRGVGGGGGLGGTVGIL
jgi:hypothetical protein